ncbi:hypothetical protein CLOM_g6238, partial [Closterium sp. NIES-68]
MSGTELGRARWIRGGLPVRARARGVCGVRSAAEPCTASKATTLELLPYDLFLAPYPAAAAAAEAVHGATTQELLPYDLFLAPHPAAAAAAAEAAAAAGRARARCYGGLQGRGRWRQWWWMRVRLSAGWTSALGCWSPP